MQNSRPGQIRARSPLASAFVFGVLLASQSPAGAQEVVGGLTPSQRPIGAPKIGEVIEREQAWYRRALTGVSQPYPASLYFLERQGNWYTPFSRPGMPGPYDIRRWHGGAP